MSEKDLISKLTIEEKEVGALKLPAVKLTTTNWQTWSKIVITRLKGYKRHRHLTDDPPNPITDDWEAADSMILSAMWDSMLDEIRDTVMQCTTAKGCWQTLETQFSGLKSMTHAYDVMQAYNRPTMGSRSYDEYWTAFRKTVAQFEELFPLTDLETVKRHRQQTHVLNFLSGLPDSFAHARPSVMSHPLARESYVEAYRLLRDMYPAQLGASTAAEGIPTEASALAASSLARRGGRGAGRGGRLESRGGGRGYEGRSSSRGGDLPTGGGRGYEGQGSSRGGDLPTGSGRGDAFGSGRRDAVGRRGNVSNSISNIECFYCHRLGHMIRDCPLNHYPRPHANVASYSSELNATLNEEENRIIQEHRDAQQASSSNTALIAQSGISCLTQSSFSPWLIDSGASDHMTGNYGMLSSFSASTHPPVRLADGSTSPVGGVGRIDLSHNLPLDSVLYMPNFPFNLLSVSSITKALQCSITFYSDHCVFQELGTGRMIGTGHVSEGCYRLDDVSSALVCQKGPTPLELHCQLGHPSLQNLKRLHPELSYLDELHCESCQLGKHLRVSYPPRVNKRSDSPFSLVHSDVWGPSPVESLGGFRYFVTFIDDFSRTTWLCLMKNRSEILSHFKTFCAEVNTQFGVCVKILRSDNAKEYFSSDFSDYLSEVGILHESSCPYTPQQNGLAERKNRHLLEVARTMLLHRQVPHQYWGDAVLTAAYLINRMPSTILQGQTPMSVLQPRVASFCLPPKIFGCICYVHNHSPTRSKLDARSIRCVFLGYSRTQKGYRCYSPTLKRCFTSADVTFLESASYFGSHQQENAVSASTPVDVNDDEGYLFLEIGGSVSPSPHNHSLAQSSLSPTISSDSVTPMIDSVPIQRPPITLTYQRRRDMPSESVLPSEATPEPISSSAPVSATPVAEPLEPLDLPLALRRTKRNVRSKYANLSCSHPISDFLTYDHLSPKHTAFISALDTHHIPRNASEALSHPGWRTAMQEEMSALEQNGTWDLVTLPAGKRCIGCKWVYTVKVNPNGSLARLKARLVAKGYSQTHGVDYEETFSPVAKMTSVRLCISLAARHHWPLHQLDVKNAFLNGILEEEVYMQQPPGFVVQEESTKVCKLRRSLYGLKQSPRAWFGRFTQVVTQFGLRRSSYDHSVFFRCQQGRRIILVVYVDDIVITGDDAMGIRDLKSYIQQQFQTKDLGQLKYFLGIEVARSRADGISLCQRKYVLDLLAESDMLGCRPSQTPMDPNSKLSPDEGELLDDPGQFRRLVGKLNYLTVTRPDISYPVSRVAQFMQTPRTSHMDAVMRILRYLKGSPGRGLVYTDGGHERVVGFCDADWAGCPTTRRSTTGYCVFVGGNLVSWRSKKQTVVSRSSAESEYRAMADLTCELLWVKRLLEEVGETQQGLMRLYSDSQSAIHIAENAVFHERTKHIEVDCHVARDNISGTPYSPPQVEAIHVSTDRQLADMLTKPLTGPRIQYIVDKLGMIDIYAPT